MPPGCNGFSARRPAQLELRARANRLDFAAAALVDFPPVYRPNSGPELEPADMTLRPRL